MFGNREYIGISLEGEFLKIARIQAHKKGLKLMRLDKLKLVQPLKSEPKNQPNQPEQDVFEEEEDLDSIFGFDDDEDEDVDPLEEIDLDNIDEEESDELTEVDLVGEASMPKTNEELLFQYLNGGKSENSSLGLNIASGNTIYQIVKDTDYTKVKKKELTELIESKLESIYGLPPAKDNYDYIVREDGALIIASIDEESPALGLVNRTKELFSRKYYVGDVIPDEVSMIGLYRNHYEPENNMITGLLQFGPDKCRMIFLRNHELLQVSPVINEGTDNKGFLNTIFSKILFQLDTGEIPGLDRIVVFNNTVGDKATDFFRKNFPDLTVENFRFNEESFHVSEALKAILPGFTTTIGIAIGASNVGKDKYPEISFLPAYVSDEQKFFKLQWHGIILLILIGTSPVILNSYYQANVAQIEQLQTNQNRLQTMIYEIDPFVDQAEELSLNLSELQEQLTLLTDLSENNIRWTVTLDAFNAAVEETGGMWINSFRQNEDVIMLDGYSLTRNSIPELASKFPEVTLLSVRLEEIREREIYYFNMMLRDVVEDTSRFTPENSREIQQLLNP